MGDQPEALRNHIRLPGDSVEGVVYYFAKVTLEAVVFVVLEQNTKKSFWMLYHCQPDGISKVLMSGEAGL